MNKVLFQSPFLSWKKAHSKIVACYYKRGREDPSISAKN